jgi:hypothetical protein
VTLREYLPVKQLHESKALALRDATPLDKKGKHILHLADASTQVLQSSPSLWLLYRQAIAAGHVSEFQRPKRPPSRPSPADRVYVEIEGIARRLVALSSEPMTLRSAVARVVELQPELLERYRRAIRRPRRASAGRR